MSALLAVVASNPPCPDVLGSLKGDILRMAERLAYQADGPIRVYRAGPEEASRLVSNARRRLRRRVGFMAWPHQRDAALALADKAFHNWTVFLAGRREAEALLDDASEIAQHHLSPQDRP